MAISIRETYRGKTVLVTGVTGFLGKIFLTLLLDRVEDVGKVYVLIRKRGLRSAAKRFEKVVNTSPVFEHLHDEHGAGLSVWLANRIEVVQGDISLPAFGLKPDVAVRLRRDLDLVVNCAGLVDFSPDIRLAVASNVHGPLSAVEFVGSCDKAGLVHVSTCYVVGKRSGRIEERIDYGYSPCDQPFDPKQELLDVEELVERTLEELDTPEAEDALRDKVAGLIEKRDLDASNETLVNNMIQRTREDRIRKVMIEVGTKRAAEWGWANTYTWSKSIGEQLFQERANELGIRWSVMRPAIVESALEFPFPGWNEGFNTCGPLAYLLGTWFRDVLARDELPFDVMPVDWVCKALLTAGAAIMEGEHHPVYQCGSSDLNQMSVGRAIELVALSHRRYYRKHGETAIDRIVLSRMDAKSKPVGHALSMKNVRKTASGLQSMFRKLPSRFGKKAQEQGQKIADGIQAADKGLKQIEKVCDLFVPFIYEHHWVFETKGLVSHDVVEDDCRFDPSTIDWRDWWLNIHGPGLRKWTFPAFEGKAVPTYKPEHRFKLLAPTCGATGDVRAAAREA